VAEDNRRNEIIEGFGIGISLQENKQPQHPGQKYSQQGASTAWSLSGDAVTT